MAPNMTNKANSIRYLHSHENKLSMDKTYSLPVAAPARSMPVIQAEMLSLSFENPALTISLLPTGDRSVITTLLPNVSAGDSRTLLFSPLIPQWVFQASDARYHNNGD